MKKSDFGTTNMNNMERKTALPLVQTVFLPKTVMGVRYINKIRTKVYVDSVERQTAALWLRGFYEINLEYHGLEGKRLYKYRVMLPLKAELPKEWQGVTEFEAADIYAAIGMPMIQILSPYVLEFKGTLSLEYVGEYIYRETRRNAELKHWVNEIPSDIKMNKNTGVDSQQEEQRRLEQKIESKIDSMFFKRETDSVHDNVSDNTNDKAYGGACEPKIIYRHIDAEMIPVKKGKAAERNVGNMNDKRCEKPAAAQSGAAHHLPVWKPLKADVVNVEEVPEKATKMTFDERFGNPLGRTANADTEIGADIDVEIGADMIKENARLDEANLVKNTSGKQGAGAVIRSNVPLFDMKSVSASVKENNSEKTENVELDKKVGVKLSEKTGNFELDKKVGVKLSEKTENFELDKKVGVKLSEKTKNLEKIKNAEKESVVENIDAPEINRSKFRSMLTTAAIARLQARGEDLNRLAETAASAASEHEKIAKSAKVVEGRAIEGKSRETVPEGKEADLSPDIVVVGNREVTEVKKMAELEEMPDIVVANAAAKESENVKSVNNVEKPVNNLGEKYVEKPVEKAVENVVENLAENLAEVTSAENIKSASAQGDEPVDEAAAEAENVEVEAVAAGVESEADVVVASVEQIEQAGKIEQVAQNERIEDNEQKGRERQDERVQLVNNNGVRLRMAARNTNDAPTAKTAASQKQGGFCLKYYVVKPGEELMKIALKNNISPEKLLAANNLSGDEPQAGTVLRIPC